jgi:ATP-dependent exoDNAse (exonuclease V) alpha subunit
MNGTSPRPNGPSQEILVGLVERVTFHNAENGFCVLRINARGHRELVTVVGHAAVISAGEWVTASGEWVNDRTHGQQYRAKFLKTSEPTSIDGIERYLSSGMIRGVGPVYAKKLVRAFGEKVFDTIETQPDRLREVAGILRALRQGPSGDQSAIRFATGLTAEEISASAVARNTASPPTATGRARRLATDRIWQLVSGGGRRNAPAR